MEPVDPYKVLGLKYGATREEIRVAWRKAARRLHPDAQPEDENSAVLFGEAHSAYVQLLSSIRDVDDTPDENTKDLPKHDPFAYWAGPAQKGANLKVFAHITLREALEGCVVETPLSYEVPDGESVGTHTALLTVRVAPSTPDGTEIRMARRGGCGWGGMTPGDLLVVIKVDKDPVWQVTGREIFAHVEITCAAGIAGAQLVIPHPIFPVQVTVPSGTFEKLHIDYPGAGIAGDAHVSVSVAKLDVSDEGVRSALAQLDIAQRKLMRTE